MAKNLMPTVAKMLGVEMGEEFKINLWPNILFKFDMSGVLAQEQGEASWHSTNRGILQELIYGSFEIIKMPWRPKKEEAYYTFYLNWKDYGDGKSYCVWEVTKYFWNDGPVDFAAFKAGWVFRTREKAEDALPNIAKEFGVKYEL